MPRLSELIRSKYPGQYDDMSDDDLESAVLSKHPEYKDLAGSSDNEPSRDSIIEDAKRPLSTPDNTALPKSEAPKQDSSWLSKAWHAVSDPLTDAPSKFAHSISNYITDPSLNDDTVDIPGLGSFKKSALKGFGAGAIEGVGDLASSFTSPLSLALLASGMGEAALLKGGLPEAAGIASKVTKGLSLPFAAHGGSEMLNPDSSLEERVHGGVELAGGLLGMHNRGGHVPDVAESIKSGHAIPESIPRELEAFNPELDNIRRNAPFGEGSILPSEVLPTEMRGEMLPNDDFPPMNYREDRMPPPSPDLTPVGQEEDYNSMFGLSGRKSAEDLAYNVARERLNMGRDLPSDVPLENPLEAPVESRTPQFNPRGQSGMTGMLQMGEDLVDSNTGEIITPDLVNEGAPPIREKTGNFFIDDTNRMKDEALSRRADPVRAAEDKANMDNWNAMQENLRVTSELEKRLGDKKNDLSREEFHAAHDQLKEEMRQSNNEGRRESTISESTKSNDSISVKSPDEMRNAGLQGYRVTGENPDGSFSMSKGGGGNDGGGKPPTLESDVPNYGEGRPQLGQKIDIKKNSKLTEFLNVPRGLEASYDLSAPFRQGLGLIHKGAWWTSWGDMVKSFGSEQAFQASQKAIAERPLFRPRGNKPSFAEESGLHLADLTDLSKREEQIMSTWAEKIPVIGRGVRASNRAYTAFLNNLRADVFEDLVKQGSIFGADGKTNLPLSKELANFVNTATGRGSLGKLEPAAIALNTAFFSPRLMASRLQMLNPMYYITANPMVRKEALKSLFAITAAGNIVTQLGRMAGGTVEKNPTSSDFGKLKLGNGVRIDPFGGFQQYITLANKLVQGKTISTNTGKETILGKKFGRATRLSTIGDFAENKLTPAFSFATGFLRGKDKKGQPFNVPEEIASRFIPIFLQDLKQLATEDPKMLNLPNDKFHPKNLPLAIPSLVGMGVQPYF